MSATLTDDAYHRARLASERLRDSDLRAADHLARVFQDKGDADSTAGKITAGERNTLQAAAGDTRAALQRECAQWHADRMAAIQVHFGQKPIRHGDPQTEAALRFVAEIDPDGEHRAPPVEPPIGTMATINHNGIKQYRRVHNGHVVAESPVVNDGWSTRKTFAPADPDEFIAAKRAGITGREEK